MGLRIGIDLGGTKIESILMDDSGAVVARKRIPTPRFDYEATRAALIGLIEGWDRHAGRSLPVGIGTPGAWEPDDRSMKNCNSTWLNGRPLLTDLVEFLGERVRMANDADCFALSEAVDGAARGADPVFGVILGTGVGGGIVVGGRLLQGLNRIAGEWGHTPLPYLRGDSLATPRLNALEAKLGDRDCYCGRRNCIETYLSGPGLAAIHRELWQADVSPVDLASRRDDCSQQSLELYALMLGRSLAQVINLIDPAVVVLGGGLSRIEALYHSVPDLWKRYVFSNRVATRLLRAQHGDASGVRGAAWLWPNESVV